MYTKEELKSLEIVPKISKISLKTIAEFYCDNLTKKSFKYKIRLHKSKDEIEIDIRFFTENLPHLLGIQKVAAEGQRYKYEGKLGYEGMIRESITIKSLKDLDKGLRPNNRSERVFPKIESRITYFYLLPQLMEKCNIVKFNNNTVTQLFNGNCNIKSDFILYHEKLGVKLHLGVVKEQNGKVYYVPQTFIVKSIRARDRDRLTSGQRFANIVERTIENID
ncbi:PBECR4 domain-containing protein [Clostridium coskatii]|jgi:hypothetical protein|uniref:Phage-Barnase-EndoU-ColicinE5/D-RelE like nuclease 4 domain-containing protein n=1 Tax=Clostridium coskatii TaxID=1705578 RepID=A0A162L6K7_9CLOT|nr:PBECR4 domain-containing protein [Clostridium coskatii]OAA85098.1 hypothetical protein WX73_03270 [Clostridium coskatii]OBR90254.1 hypothetical protein CLCOS_40880 [Clostridium coskatii]